MPIRYVWRTKNNEFAGKDLEPEQIEPSSRFGTKLNTEFIRGMGKRDNNFIMILDNEKGK